MIANNSLPDLQTIDRYCSGINNRLCADKKQLEVSYLWSEDKWGQKDPLTGLWNGVIAQVYTVIWRTSGVRRIRSLASGRGSLLRYIIWRTSGVRRIRSLASGMGSLLRFIICFSSSFFVALGLFHFFVFTIFTLGVLYPEHSELAFDCVIIASCL